MSMSIIWAGWYDEKYIIAIEETVVDEFEVKAHIAEESMKIAERSIKKEIFIRTR